MITIQLTNKGRHLGYQQVVCVPRPGDTIRFINAEVALEGNWRVWRVTHVCDRQQASLLHKQESHITMDLVK